MLPRKAADEARRLADAWDAEAKTLLATPVPQEERDPVTRATLAALHHAESDTLRRCASALRAAVMNAE